MTESVEHLIQMYGFLGAFFVLTSLLAAYIAKRFLNKEDGIATLLAKKHIAYLDKSMNTMDHMTTTQDKICTQLDSIDGKLDD